MDTQQVEVVENKGAVALQTHKSGRFRKAVAYGMAAALPLVTSAAFAEGEGITSIGAGLNTEIEASKAVILALFGIGATVLALFAGYRYMKRGANSA